MHFGEHCRMRPIRIFLILTAVSAAVVPAAPAQAAIGFGQTSISLSGQSATTLAAGDGTFDGRPDLVTGGGGAFQVGILPGDTSGLFNLHQGRPMSFTPNDVEVADFSGDGIVDVLASSPGGLTIFNTRPGGFFDGYVTPVQTVAYTATPTAIAAGDVNSDGRADSFAAAGNRIIVTYGGPSAGPTADVPIPVSSQVSDVAVADVVGSPALDLVYVDRSVNQVIVKPGIGAGSFGPNVVLPGGSSPSTLAIADLTNDGLNDILLASQVSGGAVTLTAFRNTGTALTTVFSAPVLSPASFGVGRIAAGDLDSDDIPDVAVSNESVGSIAILRGNGNATFTAEPAFTPGGPMYDIQYLPDGSGYGPGLATAGGGTLNVFRVTDPPGPVVNATATPGIRQIALSWSPPVTGGSASSYRVYASDSLGSQGPLLYVTGGLTITHGMLGNGDTRWYLIQAVNSSGAGPSTLVTATTFDVPTVPLNVAAEPGPGLYQITVRWDPPASDGGTPVSGYILCRRAGLSEECAPVNANVYTDDALLPLASYDYAVRAVNAVGEGPESAPVCSRPFPWLPELGC